MKQRKMVKTLVWIAVLGIAAFMAFHAVSGAVTGTPITLQQAFPQAPGVPPSSSAASSANSSQTPVSQTAAPPSPASTTTAPPAAPAGEIVDVAGAVKHPGVYHLQPGARNIDALNAAGGPTPQANTDAINLAAPAQDGSQLYFPTRAEHPSGGAAPGTDVSASQPSADSAGTAAAPASPAARKSRHSGSRANKLRSPSQGQVNINTASEAELERVPDIGPAMAARILAFRQQNHGFQTLDDLRQVRGIGPKKFAKMEPFLTLH